MPRSRSCWRRAAWRRSTPMADRSQAAAALDGDALGGLWAANNWDQTFVPDHHIATQLSRSGVPVLYVDPPLSLLTPLRRPELRGSVDAPRIRVLGPNL